jgi:hypothetical protein
MLSAVHCEVFVPTTFSVLFCRFCRVGQAALFGILCAIPASAAHTFVSFDVPGAALTYPAAINASGEVAGIYRDSVYAYHGFIRESNGAITSFDIASGQGEVAVTGINGSGQIAGWYLVGSSNTSHGFLRDHNGTITIIDEPSGIGTTSVFGLNDLGGLAGTYWVSTGPFTFTIYGFVRNPNGVFTSFSDALSTDTEAVAINSMGQAAGFYAALAEPSPRGFVRSQSGKLTGYDPPGSTGLFAFAINRGEQIAGYYFDSNGIMHGYLRNSNGSISVIDAPGAGTSLFTGTLALSINDAGQVTGYTINNSLAWESFVRDASGGIMTFNAPKAGTTGYHGTQASSINANGTVTGYYTDANGIAHGFVRF